jgi:hypothetical protein
MSTKSSTSVTTSKSCTGTWRNKSSVFYGKMSDNFSKLSVPVWVRQKEVKLIICKPIALIFLQIASVKQSLFLSNQITHKSAPLTLSLMTTSFKGMDESNYHKFCKISACKGKVLISCNPLPNRVNIRICNKQMVSWFMICTKHTLCWTVPTPFL